MLLVKGTQKRVPMTVSICYRQFWITHRRSILHVYHFKEHVGLSPTNIKLPLGCIVCVYIDGIHINCVSIAHNSFIGRMLKLFGLTLFFFKPGAPAAGRRAPGFLKLILCGSSVCVFACVCVSAPEAIDN